MKVLMWILLIMAIGATELQHDGICLRHGSIRLKHDSICLQHDSICQVALAEDTAQVTCTFSKDVYQEKVAFGIEMSAANSDDPSTVAACLWEAEDSPKPACKLFSGIHLNESITNVVAIKVPVNRLPAGGGRFVCKMVNQDGNDFLPCSWTDPEPQSTATPGISDTSTSTGELRERTDPHDSCHCNLAMGAHIFGTFIVTVLLYSLVLVILWYKRVIQYNRRLRWKHRTRGEKTKTEEPEENGKLRSAEDDAEEIDVV